MKSMKENIKKNGLIYINVFSNQDPRLTKNSTSKDFEVLDNNVLHNKINDTYISFFTKEEILELFTDLKTIYISEEYCLDLGFGDAHYAGVIKYIGQKI